jgi:hypothetical protein
VQNGIQVPSNYNDHCNTATQKLKATMMFSSSKSTGIAAILFSLTTSMVNSRRESLAFVAPRGPRQGHAVFINGAARQQTLQQQQQQNSWNEEHLAHGMGDVQEETDAQIRDSEDAAAWDAHDCSDPGMEAAAEERAVMFAAEMIHKMKGGRKKDEPKKVNTWNEEHVARGVTQVHEETEEELKDSEDAASWDAHDCSDAGMEAAAEERAVMLAAEMIRRMKGEVANKSTHK